MSYATGVPNNNFYENIFLVSKECIRSWSHASLITDLRTFAKKLWIVHPKSLRTKWKRRKKRKAIAKFFALHANAITVLILIRDWCSNYVFFKLVKNRKRMVVTTCNLYYFCYFNLYYFFIFITHIVYSVENKC